MTDFNPSRRRPYKTGEMARLFEADRNTIIRWINEGRFGEQGIGWDWTAAGPGHGDRIVFAKAVRRFVERGA